MKKIIMLVFSALISLAVSAPALANAVVDPAATDRPSVWELLLAIVIMLCALALIVQLVLKARRRM